MFHTSPIQIIGVLLIYKCQRYKYVKEHADSRGMPKT
jgi:hypothetical protein